MVRVHLQRLFENRAFYVSLFIGICLTTSQFIFSVINSNSFPSGSIPKSSYLTWLGANGFDTATTIYLFLLTLLAAIPYGAQLYIDKKTGYYELVISKSSKLKYHSSIATVNFIAGWLVVSLPVLFNFYLHSLKFRAIKPNPVLYYDKVPGEFSTLFYNLFNEHPLIHTVIYIGLFGLVGSMMAAVSLASSLVIQKKIFIYATPFIFQLLLFSFPISISLNPMEFLLTVSTSVVQLKGVCIFFILSTLLCSSFYFLGMMRK